MSDAAEKRDKVLAIDDDRTFLEFEAEVLERHGIGVVTAGTADEALEVLRRERDISLVLLDVVLEDSSGMDLCRAIKSDESTGGVLVMFVTGQVQPEDVAGLLDAGGDEFSFKPFHIDEFMARVKAMLRQAHRGKVLTESLREAERLADIRTTELDEMRRFADAIVASMASGIVVADGDMRILFANEAFCRMMSLECSGCKGMDLARIVGDKFLSQVDLRVLAGEVVVSGEPREVTGIHHAAGPRDERIMDLRMRPVTYGGTVDTLIVFNDVTDKWLAQEAIRVEAEQLQDMGVLSAAELEDGS